MTNPKFLASVCALALAAVAVAACKPKAPAPEADAVLKGAPAAPENPNGFPQWAFPGPLVESVPGSAVKLSEVQMFDRTAAVDWFPATHPDMPESVKGHPAQYACGFCHLPQGAGRSENAALAGLPEKYILEQLAAFKSGERKTPDPKFGAAVNMERTGKQVNDEDAQSAAKYYAGLKYVKHLKLIETAEVPSPTSNAFVYEFDKTGKKEPIGQRLFDGPDDFRRFEMRDPNMTYTAYVPVGAVARGEALAKGNNDSRPACETCHGPGLKGTEIGPPIAGRLPTGLFRQMYAIQTGSRHNEKALLMKPVVASLSQKDMIDLAAYVASLEP